MDALSGYTTWRWLWAHTARQIIAALALPADYERVEVAYGTGVRSCGGDMALLLHPSGAGHAIGDLSLTIAGQPAAVIPRDGRAYTDYVEHVATVVGHVLQASYAHAAARDEALADN
jgi:nitrous oxidase accessory protein NosD